MGEALAGDSQVVASFLRDDARKRATSLIVPALDEDIRTHLAKVERIAREDPQRLSSNTYPSLLLQPFRYSYWLGRLRLHRHGNRPAAT